MGKVDELDRPVSGAFRNLRVLAEGEARASWLTGVKEIRRHVFFRPKALLNS